MNKTSLTVQDMMAIEAVVQCLKTAEIEPKELESVMGLCELLAWLMHTQGGHSYEAIGQAFVEYGLALSGLERPSSAELITLF